MEKNQVISPVIVGKVVPGNNPVRVADSTEVPYRFVGLLSMKFPNEKSYYGTATLLFEPGATHSSYVLTCAHNLYDKADGGEAIAVSFTRAFNDPAHPYDPIEATHLYYPAGYPDVAISKHADVSHVGTELLAANIDLDYAVVKLKTPVEVANIPQIVVKTTPELKDLPVQINGYGIFNKKMSHATGTLSRETDKALFYAISTMQGASGSAIMMNDNKSIVGIHTRSVSGEDLNQGVRITAEIKRQIDAWISGSQSESESVALSTSTSQAEE